jgi:WD40 repeat protein
MILLVMMLAAVSSGLSPGGGSLPEGAIARLGTLRFNHGSDLSGVAFTQNGRCVVSMGRHGGVRVWETASAREMFTIGGGHVHTDSFAVAADGKSLMTFDEDGLFRRWDLATGRELHHWKLPGKMVFFNFMATSPDGKTLVLAGLNNKAASLWDLEKLGQPQRLAGDERSIWDIAFSRDGRMVATAAMDGIPRDFGTTVAVDRNKDRERGSVRLWDVMTGRRRSAFR